MRARIAGLVAVLLVVSACGGPSSNDAPDSTVDGSSVGTTAQVTKAQPDWITYTDETANFELSYPNEWVLLEIDDAVIQGVLEPLAEGSGLDVQAFTTVFGVGLEETGGLSFDPNTSIGIEPLPFAMDADEYASAAVNGAKQLFSSWETSSRSKIRVGAHEGVLTHSSYAISEIDPSVTDDSRWWTVQLFIPVEAVAWVVSCGTESQTESDAQEEISTCEEVLRTFDLLTS